MKEKDNEIQNLKYQVMSLSLKMKQKLVGMNPL